MNNTRKLSQSLTEENIINITISSFLETRLRNIKPARELKNEEIKSIITEIKKINFNSLPKQDYGFLDDKSKKLINNIIVWACFKEELSLHDVNKIFAISKIILETLQFEFTQ
jgi:hypothetical protein